MKFGPLWNTLINNQSWIDSASEKNTFRLAGKQQNSFIYRVQIFKRIILLLFNMCVLWYFPAKIHGTNALLFGNRTVT